MPGLVLADEFGPAQRESKSNAKTQVSSREGAKARRKAKEIKAETFSRRDAETRRRSKTEANKTRSRSPGKRSAPGACAASSLRPRMRAARLSGLQDLFNLLPLAYSASLRLCEKMPGVPQRRKAASRRDAETQRGSQAEGLCFKGVTERGRQGEARSRSPGKRSAPGACAATRLRPRMRAARLSRLQGQLIFPPLPFSAPLRLCASRLPALGVAAR